jgi:hypothetical protein
MPADELQTLMDIETNIEPGIATLIASQTGIASVSRFGKPLLTTPRIEVSLDPGAVSGHAHIHLGSTLIYDTWDYSLTFRVVTKRGGRGLDNGNTDADHANARAKIRTAMLYATALLTSEVMPYHQLVTADEAGTTPSVDAGEDVDASELSYRGVLGIRSDAWPVE